MTINTNIIMNEVIAMNKEYFKKFQDMLKANGIAEGSKYDDIESEAAMKLHELKKAIEEVLNK